MENMKNLILNKNIKISNFLYIFVFLLLFLFSCRNFSGEPDNLFDSVNIDFFDTTKIDSINNTNSNNFVVKKQSVIFFMPSNQEKKEINKQYGEYAKYDFEQIYSDFFYLANYSKRKLRKKKIHSELTNSLKFEI